MWPADKIVVHPCYKQRSSDPTFLFICRMLTFFQMRSILVQDTHGRPQTFFQGGQKIFHWGARAYFLLKKQTKKTHYFCQKSPKTYYFWPAFAGQGGQELPLPPPPPDAHEDTCFYPNTKLKYLS